MATGTIKNQFTGTWTSVNANLKYQVRSGIVFVWVQGSGSNTEWISVGTLPSNVCPNNQCYNSAYADASVHSNFYISTTGSVMHRGNSVASTIMSYPLL